MFTKDEKGHMVLIIKYVTTSIKYQILEIKEIKFKEGEENIIYIEYKPEKNIRSENFRTSEGAAIIKKNEAEEKKKIDNIGANLNDILSFP